VSKYILDTNLYIYAARDLGWKASLRAFLERHMPDMYLHSTVATELLAGARTPQLERETQRRLIEPFEATGRVITPTHGSWKRAGQTVARLVRDKVMSANGIPGSFLNDCLIAASARDQGVTIVTDNVSDFQLISSVTRVDYVAPWPGRAAG
jgi:predicted nucleic acid-binding protein